MIAAVSLLSSQTFDSEGKMVEDTTMQALEVFCTCWFTFEVSEKNKVCLQCVKLWMKTENTLSFLSLRW